MGRLTRIRCIGISASLRVMPRSSLKITVRAVDRSRILLASNGLPSSVRSKYRQPPIAPRFGAVGRCGSHLTPSSRFHFKNLEEACFVRSLLCMKQAGTEILPIMPQAQKGQNTFQI